MHYMHKCIICIYIAKLLYILYITFYLYLLTRRKATEMPRNCYPIENFYFVIQFYRDITTI